MLARGGIHSCCAVVQLRLAWPAAIRLAEVVWHSHSWPFGPSGAFWPFWAVRDPQNHPFAHISLKRSQAAGAPMRSRYYPRPGLSHPPAPLDCACCWGELGCGLRWHYGFNRLKAPFWALKRPNSPPDFPKIDVSGGISPSWGPISPKTLGGFLAEACRSRINPGFVV